MDEITIKIENKLKTQVEHIFNIHNTEHLKDKVYDLAFEWYLKGLHTGIESEKEFNKRQKEVK